ncbi:MAG: hypothetical protein J6X22_02315 [Muribaculaceae bacterium]|nr:hypothetical protein [Muribaculaceae bacterium]
MKKILSILLCLCAVMAVQAQVIKKGDAFWNGKVLYTVSEIRMGKIVYMQGVDASGNFYELTLEKVGKKAGNYKLIPSRQADDSPFRCPWNSRVTYVRKNGMYFLAVHNAAANLIVETLVLTPDNIINCQSQFEDVKERPISSIASTYLFNEELTTFLFTEEMKKHVKKFASKKNRTVIEDTNLQLMKSELEERESSRDDNGF